MQSHPLPAQDSAHTIQPLDPNQRHPHAIGAQLCVDCAHAVPQRLGNLKCAHPRLGYSPVSGLPRLTYCTELREPRHDDPAQHCGVEGRWFSPSASAPQCPSEPI